MAKNVFTISPDVSFVEVLACGLWREAGGDPLKLTATLVLLPTRRANRHLREAFLRVVNGQAALLPRMQPLGDVDETELYFSGAGVRESGFDILPTISPLRRQMLLTRLVAQKDKTLPLDQAAQLAEALAGLLDQVQIEERDFAVLRNLVPDDYARHWQDTLKFLEIVTSAWPKVLKAEGCLDPAERRNRILHEQADAWRATPPSFPVVAAGSTASMPAVADLMDVIAGMPLGRVVLPGLDTALDEEAWQAIGESHPQYGMKRWLEKAGVERGDVGAWTSAFKKFEENPSPAKSKDLHLQVQDFASSPSRGEDSKPHHRVTCEARVRLLQEAMRPANTTGAWHVLTQDDIPADACVGLERLELEHQQEEADVIALRLRAALEEKDKTAALVTPDRALAGRVTAALQRWGIEANDSAGAPLASLPVGSFLRDVWQAAAPEASAVDYLSLLKHPLAACGVEPAQCRHYARQVEMDTWRGVRLESGWDGTVRLLRTQEARYSRFPPSLKLRRTNRRNDAKGEHAHNENQSDRKGGLISWLENIAGWFDPITLAWPTEKPIEERVRDHMELAEKVASTHGTAGAQRLWRGEAGEAAATFFDEWLEAVKDMPPITGGEYARLLGELLRGVTVRPAYGAHPRLSILGPLEARLHHADLVILGGMNEGTWPPSPAIDPWLSRPMKRDFGLPLPERRVGLSAHDFVQLASAPEVLITRARRVDGSPTVPSRFLLQVEAVLAGVGDKENSLAPSKPWNEWAQMLDAPDKVKPCDPPEPCPPVEARPDRLSVTEIGTWLRNPYAIYARRILRLEPLDPLDADVSAAERGTIIHEALEKFLRLHQDTWPKDPLETLLTLGRDVFAPLNDRPQVAAFWWPRFEKIAQWFVEREQARRQAGLHVLAVEGKGSVTLANGAFTLTGRADRIDKLSDGSCAIIDYKTGTLPSQKAIAAGYEPQLPLLGMIAEAGGFEGLGALRTGALSYWQLKGGREEEKDQDVKGDLADLIAKTRERLELLIAEFAKPLTPYRAVPRPLLAPRYDDYAHLARLAEWGREGGEE